LRRYRQFLDELTLAAISMTQILLLILLLRPLLVFDANHPPAPEKRIVIKLIIPEKAKQVESTPCLNLKVLFINHTDTAVSFFEDWNSWGYFNIGFEIKSGDTTYLLTKKDRDWPKNFPSFKTLFPGDSMEFNFSHPMPDCSFSQYSGLINTILNPGNSIRAIYQLDEAVLNDVKRTGFVDSTTMIRYKYKKINNLFSRSRDSKDWIIVDSLEKPVPLFQTFPLGKFESTEYSLY
jgi:hypothetical protein